MMRNLKFLSIVPLVCGLAFATPLYAKPSTTSLSDLMVNNNYIHIGQIFVSADPSADRRYSKVLRQSVAFVNGDYNLLRHPLQNHNVRPIDVAGRVNAVREIFVESKIPINVRVWFSNTGVRKDMHVVLFVSKASHFDRLTSHGFSNNLVKYYQQKMRQQHNLNKKFDHYAALMRTIPGLRMGYYYQPGAKYSPSNVAMLQNMRRITGYADFNNTGNKVAGRYIFGTGFSLHQIFANDALSVNGAISNKFNRMKMGMIDYHTLIGPYGTKLDLNFVYNWSKSPAYTLAYQFRGNGRRYQVAVTQPIIMQTQEQFLITAGYALINGQNLGDSQDFPGGVPSLDTRDRIPLVFANFDFSALNPLGNFWGNLAVTQGLRQGASFRVIGRPANLTPESDPKSTFMRINVGINQRIYFKHDLSLLISGKGQFSRNNPLYMSQKFGFNDGAYVGQALLGDYGMAGRTELDWNWLIFDSYLRQVQFFGFGAVGYVRNPKEVLISYEEKTGATVGLGARLMFTEHLAGFFELARPFMKLPVDQDRSVTYPFFGLTADF
jgi:hypothetical protein